MNRQSKGLMIDMPRNRLPLVALRDTVVFPKFVVPLFIGRPKSIKAIETSYENDRLIAFVTQRDPTLDLVTPEDLYRFGTVCHIDQMISLTDGTVKILADGIYRAKIEKIIDDDMMLADVSEATSDRQIDHKKLDALRLAVLSNFEAFFKQNRKPSNKFNF